MSEVSLHSENTKSWKTVAVFLTYKEASEKKDALINDYASIKIKRGKSLNKEVFRIKAWNPPKKKEKEEEKRKTKQKFKKGKSDRRVEKNVNKKIYS